MGLKKMKNTVYIVRTILLTLPRNSLTKQMKIKTLSKS